MRLIRWVMVMVMVMMCAGCMGAGAGPLASGQPLFLTEAIQRSLQNHPALLEARQREKAARAGVQDARSAREVQLRFDAQRLGVNDVPELSLIPGRPAIQLGDTTVTTSKFTAQKVVSSGGKIEAGIKQAGSLANSAQCAVHRTRQLIAFDTERSYLQLVLAQREQEVASQAFETASEYLRVARSRYEAKSVAKFDVLRAEVQLEESKQDCLKADALIQTSHAALLQALGASEGNFTATETGIIASFAVPVLESSLDQALTNRPEMQTSDWTIKAANAGIQAAKGERQPTITVIADYQRVQPEQPFQINRWTTLVAAGFPILDGGHGRAKLNQARAQLDQQKAGREALRNTIEKEVRQAHAKLTSSISQLEVAKKRVEFAEEMVRITHVRYSSGISTATEVADAQTTLNRARQGLIRSVSEARMAEAELRLAVGADPDPEDPVLK